jgi:FAD:protein FMN transferase
MSTAVASEARVEFPCFGGHAAVAVGGGEDAESVALAAGLTLERWHERFTRFEPSSELSMLNADPRETVPVSEIMCRFVEAAVWAASETGGLVDPTLLGEIEDAGYRRDLTQPPPLELSLGLARERRPARPSLAARWRHIEVDVKRSTVTRPVGVLLDSGGVAKGMFADVLGARLSRNDSFAIDCSGDLLVGGRRGLTRTIRVDDPFGRGVLHEFELGAGGIATSGIGRRSWLDADARPAHHLLDPATGMSAFTGVVQATALAPSALEAEALAKAALLSGPRRAASWLRHGGVIVLEDGTHHVRDAR